jgi:tetratricopeptide (TPR) repeat protein
MSAELESALERLNTQLLVNPKDPWTRFKQARTLHRLGRLDQAISSYESAIRGKPDMADAHFHLGTCFLVREQLEAAAASFHAAAAAKPDYLEALLAEADALLALGRPGDAAPPLTRAAELDPSNLPLLLKLAQVQVAAERFEEAVTMYERARRLAPADLEIQLALARVMCRARRWHPARALLTELAPATKKREAYSLLAEACLGLEQREAALEAYGTSLGIEPEHLPTLIAAATLDAALGRDDTASERFARARALGPDTRGLAGAHGEVLLRTKQVDAAAEAFRKELGLDESNAAAHAGLGACLRLQGRAVEALAELERARALDPASATMHLELAHVYDALNRSDEARASLHEAETRGANDPTIWSRLAHHHLGKERDAEALAAFDRSLALHADNADALYQRGRLLMRQSNGDGREQDALKALLESRRLRPEHGATLAAIGAIYRRLERHAEAVSVLEALRERERAPGQRIDVEARAGLGDSLQKLERQQDALDAFRQVLAEAPDHVPAERGAATAMLALGLKGDGVAGLRRAAARAPGDAALLAQLARAEIDAGELDAAEKTLAGALETAPGDATVLTLRGELLLRRERPADAVAALERAEWVSPANPRVRELLGEALQASGRGEEAVELLREAAARGKSAGLLRRLGLLLLDLGRVDEGVPPLEEALAMGLPGPQAGEAHHRLGLALEKLARTAAAAEHFREASRALPDLPDAYVHAAACYAATGAHRDAVQAARQWARLRPFDVRALLQVARSSRALGRDDEASKAYREALALDPDGLEALRELGALELARRDHESAERALRRALAHAPGNRELLAQLATALEALGQDKPLYDTLVSLSAAGESGPAHELRLAGAADRAGYVKEAIVAYRRGLNVETAPAAAAERLARRLFDGGNAEEALPWFKRAASAAPSAASAALGLASCLAQLGLWPEALDSARVACRLNPALWQAQRLRGQAAMTSQRWGEAAEAFAEVLGQEPDDGESRYGWALACDKLGRAADARQALQLLVRKQPEHDRGWWKLAELLAADRQNDAAREAATRAMDADVSRPEAPTLLGRLQQERGDLDAAIAAFRIALERSPAHGPALRGLGLALVRKGDFGPAADALGAALAQDGRDADALAGLAVSYERLGRARDALTTYQGAVQAGRDDAILFMRVAALAESLGLHEEAVDALRQVARKSPNDFAVQKQLGTNLRLLKRTADALGPLRLAVTLRPDNADAAYQLGLCFIEAGSPVLAREQHKRLLTLDPALADRLRQALAAPR